MSEILIRFFIGGAVVSAFVNVSDLLKPKSFAGLFGAAPSVALATLGLTAAREGASYAATEARSMMVRSTSNAPAARANVQAASSCPYEFVDDPSTQ
jgi:hypothetical protein